MPYGFSLLNMSIGPLIWAKFGYYNVTCQELSTRCKRRSLVVFFTDLIDEETSSELVTYMRLLRPVHLPLCVTLRDVAVLL